MVICNEKDKIKSTFWLVVCFNLWLLFILVYFVQKLLFLRFHRVPSKLSIHTALYICTEAQWLEASSSKISDFKIPKWADIERSEFQTLCSVRIEICWSPSFVNSVLKFWIQSKFFYARILKQLVFCAHISKQLNRYTSRNSLTVGFRKAEISGILFTNENFCRFVSVEFRSIAIPNHV